MDINVIKSLADAGTVVVCLGAVLMIWKAYNARIDEHIADLRALAFREVLPPKSNPHLPGHPQYAPSLN